MSELTTKSSTTKATAAGSTDEIDKLCFNRALFNRPDDFDVGRFLSITRRRATLDQIYNDLRTYLRYLQTQMIDLINDDYADFVNLSSSLQSLLEPIERITGNINAEWSQFTDAIAELEQTASMVKENLELLKTNRKSQIAVRNKLQLITTLERLVDCVNYPEKTSTNWLSGVSRLLLSLELWFRQVPAESLPEGATETRELCNSRLFELILEVLKTDLVEGETCESLQLGAHILELIGKEESGIDQLANEFQRKLLPGEDDGVKGDYERMKRLFDNANKIRVNLAVKAREQLQTGQKSELFLDRALIASTSCALEKNFSSVLVPLDAALFHRCFLLATKFVREFPSSPDSASKADELVPHFQALIDRFSLTVYFKLVTQPFRDAEILSAKPENFTSLPVTDEEGDTEGDCLCAYSNNLLAAIRCLISDGTYLDAIVDRIWEFVLRSLRAYLGWADSMINHFSTKVVDSVDTPKNFKSVAPWLSLAILSKDLALFDTRLFDLCLNVFWGRLRALDVDTTPFGRCLSLFAEQLSKRKKKANEKIAALLVKQISENLAGVSEIPRQYRWTKRPSPSCFSTYLVPAFSFCETFAEEAAKFGWTKDEIEAVLKAVVAECVDSFCERAEKVIETVEQTGTSLQRFKRKAIGGGGGGGNTGGEDAPAAETDEAKIRAQLVFDLDFVCQRCEERGIPRDRLQLVKERASGGTSGAGGNTVQ